MSASTARVTSHTRHVGGALIRQARSAMASSHAPGDPRPSASGWLVVTVFREPSEVEGPELPAPLAEFAEPIEVRGRRPADGKGTELAARLREQPSSGTVRSRLSGTDPQ